MNPYQFCFWLQGLLDSSDSSTLDARQTKLIRDRLDTIFVHVVEPKPSQPAQPIQPTVFTLGGSDAEGTNYRC